MSPAPTKTLDRLERIVRSGNVARCLEFFADMPEKERRQLAPLARRLFREREEGPFDPCQRIAVLATASLTEIKRFRDDVLPGRRSDGFDAEYAVLENRRPAWLLSWCTWTLESRFACWPLVRRLVRDGICPEPDTDQYVLSMISGAIGWPNHHSVLDTLRSDPELLDNMVWRLFEIEGNSHATLSREGKYDWREENEWAHALRELSKEGRIDRDRLLERVTHE